MMPKLKKQTSQLKLVETSALPIKSDNRKAIGNASPVLSKKRKAVKEVKVAKEIEGPKYIKAKKSKKVKISHEPDISIEPEKSIETEKSIQHKKSDKPKKSTEPEQESGLRMRKDDVATEELDEDLEALVQGLDSSSDSDNSSDPKDVTFKPGQDVGKIPSISVGGSKPKKARNLHGREPPESERGVIYIGRIPHGFYEHEMRQYFSQFGPVTRLRLSRNPRTGASRHFAFVEFAEAATADIAARTMNNYLLFGHILKCRVVEASQLHAEVWKGANRRFKKVPWQKLDGQKLKQPRPESYWTAKVQKERRKRVVRAEKLKELMYEFEGPELQTPVVPPPQQEQQEQEQQQQQQEQQGQQEQRQSVPEELLALENGGKKAAQSEEVKPEELKQNEPARRGEESLTLAGDKSKAAADAVEISEKNVAAAQEPKAKKGAKGGKKKK